MVSSVFFAISALLLVSIAQAIRRDPLWTINLKPSNDYEGELEILAVFKDGKQHSVTLPVTKFEKGETSTFDIGLASNGSLQMVYLRTHGVCPLGLLPLTVLRLQEIQLTSNDANTTYTKFLKDLAIKDFCQNNKSLGTTIKDLDEFNPSYCLVEGKQYRDGEQFAMGCSANCKCSEGRMACVDMCPASAWSSERKCHFVHVPGECCDAIRCEADEGMNSCDAKIVDGSTNTSVGGTRAPPPVRRYPWSVLLCVDTKCSQVYGGVIVGSRHILTFSPDLTSFDNLRFVAGQYIAGASNSSDFSSLRIVNITVHTDFVNHDSPIADSASRLQLLQTNQMFNFDKQIQSANLPFNKNQCAQLAKDNCPLMTVGWDRTDDQDDEIRQWFLHAEKSKSDQSACTTATATNGTNGTGEHPKSVVRGPRRRGDARVCVSGLSRSDCTGPLGGAVVSNRGQIDFLVGILDPDMALFKCTDRGTASLLPLCKYVDWITSITTAGNF